MQYYIEKESSESIKPYVSSISEKYKTQQNLYHANVWKYLANKGVKKAKEIVREFWTYTFPINELFRVLDDLKIEYMIGPYNHLAQIS